MKNEDVLRQIKLLQEQIKETALKGIQLMSDEIEKDKKLTPEEKEEYRKKLNEEKGKILGLFN